MIFDTHAHYDDHAFDEDRDRILSGLASHGVGNVMDVSAKLEDLPRILQLAEQYDFLYASSGVHPSETNDLEEDPDGFRRVEEALSHPKVLAVGEIGLDYHYDDTDKPLQKKWFAAQIDLAKRHRLPIIIHSRDAAADTLDMMKAEGARDAGGVMHCYGYSREMARDWLDMGFYLGIGGAVTFKNARRVKEVVEYAPIDRIVLETDCPYMAPVPYRGKRNDSALIPYVAEEVARLKKMDPVAVTFLTEISAKELYRI